MCGHDWCSVRISKEINEFYSGKDEGSQPVKKAVASPGVNEAGAEVLRQRGVLSQEEIEKMQARRHGGTEARSGEGGAKGVSGLTQEEIMKLAHRGKKADCHSDKVKDAGEAKVIQINTLKAHGVRVNEAGL
jgi:phosphomethylpyrimidine synthase